MLPTNPMVRIPEPCHEDWNQMQPDAKGRFCCSCSKSVVDFTTKSDAEILSILAANQGQKLCGHFKISQLERPLKDVSPPASKLKASRLTHAFVIAVFLVFGSMLFSCKDEHGRDVEQVPVASSQEYILGNIKIDLPAPLAKEEIILSDAPVAESIPAIGLAVCQEIAISGGIGVFESVVVEEKPAIQEESPLMMGVFDFTANQSDSVSAVVVDSARSKEKQILTTHSPVLVYPNPSSGTFSISYELTSAADVSIAVFDLNGSLVKQLGSVPLQHTGRYTIPVELHGIPSGTYIVNFIKNGQRYSERVVIVE